jgi:hypothetical protein
MHRKSVNDLYIELLRVTYLKVLNKDFGMISLLLFDENLFTDIILCVLFNNIVKGPGH